MATAVFQIRTDPELLQEVRDLAKKRRVSANHLVIDAIKTKIKLEKEQEWREGFEAMGRDPDMDVEYMLPAAMEVLFGQ